MRTFEIKGNMVIYRRNGQITAKIVTYRPKEVIHRLRIMAGEEMIRKEM